MLKNENGITLLALIITVIIMIILVSAGIRYGGTSLSEIKLQNFSYELQQIQGRVDAIYEKMSMEDNPSYITLNDDILGLSIINSSSAMDTLDNVKGIDYSIASKNDEKLFNQDEGKESYYRYFSKDDLESTLDIKNASQDVIINFKTREVISVKGQTYNDKTYYRLQDIKD